MPKHKESTALLLAGIAQCDARTAERALREGTGKIKGYVLRARLERALHDLGLAPAVERAAQ